MSVTLRPSVASDDQFLFELYASTRRGEVAAWGWDIAQQDAFLRMQVTAQQRAYSAHGGDASKDIILQDGEPIGRLLVVRTTEEIHLVDIALLPASRSHGVGTALIGNLLDEGDNEDRLVRLEVLKNNRAALLYERLGFVKTGESGLHFQMERRPVAAR